MCLNAASMMPQGEPTALPVEAPFTIPTTTPPVVPPPAQRLLAGLPAYDAHGYGDDGHG